MAGGGGDNRINLAALFVPIMPETEHLQEKVALAGREAGSTFILNFKQTVRAEEAAAGWGAQMGQGLLQGFERTGAMQKLSGMFGGLSLSTLGVTAGIAGITLASEKLFTSMVHVGEQFEDMHRNLEIFTTASGKNLDEMKSHADQIVSRLDTSMQNVGKDMATLATRLKMEPGAALDNLVRQVEELRDRFGSLNTSDLAGALVQFGIDGNNAADALAAIRYAASDASVPIDTIISALAAGGPTFKELHLNLDQAVYMLDQLNQQGLNAEQAVTLLGRAEKGAAKEHKTVAQFIQDEIGYINQLAQSHQDEAADREAFDAFGIKGWALAVKGAQAYQDTLKKTPDELHHNKDETDKFSDSTETLANKWTKLLNTMRQAAETHPFIGIMSPFLNARQITDELGGALDWIDQKLSHIFHFDLPTANPGQAGTGSYKGFPAPPPGGAPRPGQLAPSMVPPPGTTGSPPSFAPWDTGGAAPSGYTKSFNWDEVARAESSGNWANADTGHNGHYGGLQFAPATWNMFGGTQFADRADHATREQQIEIANRVAFTGFGGNKPQGLGAWETITNGSAHVSLSGYGSGGNDFMSSMPTSFGAYGGLQQVIFSNKMTGQKTGEAGPLSGGGAPGGGGNQIVGPGTANPGYYAAYWEGHTDHVHTSWTVGPDGQPYGLPANTNISAGGPGFPDWVYQLGAQFGLIASTYPGHQVLADGLQHGIDWTPAATGWSNNYSGDQIDDLQNFASSMATAGASASGSPSGSVSLMDWHGSTGSGSGRSMDWSGGRFGPSIHGGYGGRGPVGPKPVDPNKIDEAEIRRQRALEDANDNLNNANDALKQWTQNVKDAEGALEAANNNPDLWAPVGSQVYNEAAKARDKAKKEWEHATKEQERAEREVRRAGEDLQLAKDKQNEPLPGTTDTRTGAGRYGYQQDAGYSAAHQFGAGLLGGVAQSLGFPDIFGKPPWEFGAFKLLAGLANWGFGMANAIGDVGGYTAGGPNIAGPASPQIVAGDGARWLPKFLGPDRNAGQPGSGPAGIPPASVHSGSFPGSSIVNVGSHLGAGAPTGGSGPFSAAGGSAISSAIQGGVQLVGALMSDLDPSAGMAAGKEMQARGRPFNVVNPTYDNSVTINNHNPLNTTDMQSWQNVQASHERQTQIANAPGGLGIPV